MLDIATRTDRRRTPSAAEHIEAAVKSVAAQHPKLRVARPTDDCPVLRLALEAKRMDDAHIASDEANVGNPIGRDKFFAEDTRSMLDDRRSMLAQTATGYCTTSALGAIYQLSVVAGLVGLLSDMALKDGIDAIEQERDSNRATSALYSVLRFIERETGASRYDVNADAYMPEFLDPHVRVERAVQGLHGVDTSTRATTPRSRNAGDDRSDPLLEILTSLRSVEARMDAAKTEVATDDAEQSALLAQLTFNPPTPTTMQGAAMAIRFVADEIDLDSDHTRIKQVLAAVLGFLERRHMHSAADPLAELLEAMRHGDQAYEADPLRGSKEMFDGVEGERIAINRTYGPPYELLQNSPPAASSLRGVEAALRFCSHKENGDEVTIPVARAALAYFEAPHSPRRPAPDPVFALIERHKALYRRVGELTVDDDENSDWTAAVDVASDAMQAIADCEPTTLAGCRAAASYIADHPTNVGHSDYQLVCDAHATMARALEKLIPQHDEATS